MEPDTRSEGTVLIIDDDELFCDAVRDHLQSENGLQVEVANTGTEGIAALKRQHVDVVLLDQMLPDAKGHELCPKILELHEEAKIIFITAHPSFEGAVEAIRAGAQDYLSKPFELEELSLAVDRALKMVALEKVARLEDYKRSKETREVVLVDAGGLSEVKKLVELAAEEQAPVLITGETGTGKNVVAKAIHFQSAYAKKPFVSINCASLPENLIEAELFGHAKGAFTGATGAKRGIFEMAEGGTLFLDEIGEMPINLQTKLLGVLEDKQVRRIGGESFHKVNVRVLAATSKDLEQELGQSFRTDLYYRLSVIRIHIPPLRERRQDIPALATYMLSQTVSTPDEPVLDEHEMEKLVAYDWPGNVRELKNILERAAILGRDREVNPSDLISAAGATGGGASPPPRPAGTSDGDILPLEEIEKRHILQTLQRLDQNLTRTAKALGIALSTLKRKLKNYGMR